MQKYINLKKEEKMRRISWIVAVLTLVVMAVAPLAAQSAEKKVKSEVVMKVGKTVSLFHSGTADVKKEICLNDTITVYRQLGKNPQLKEVGKVKVLDYEGEHYFKAEVVSGEIKIGDIAKKETASCLIQPVR